MVKHNALTTATAVSSGGNIARLYLDKTANSVGLPLLKEIEVTRQALLKRINELGLQLS